MSDKVHWVIPGAALALEARPQASASHEAAPLPNLRRLLGAMTPTARLELPEDSPALPHEMLLARLHGLAGEPGHVPWTAFEQGIAGTPCATLKLCHWQVGTDNVMLSPPDALGLKAEDARTLLAAMSPYFDEDGITLAEVPNQPGSWLATGEPLRDLATISLDRAVGKRLTRSFFEAKGVSAALIRKLQNEMQMLLYTHPVNDDRAARGQQPVNSFWIHGSGRYTGPAPSTSAPIVADDLRQPALQRDWAQWARAWHQVDQGACSQLLAELQADRPASLVLCSERHALVFEKRPAGWVERLRRRFNTASLQQYAPQL